MRRTIAGRAARSVGSTAVTTSPARPIVVIGEALIDLVETGDDEPRLARPGGSPYNVAIGLARLDRPTAFAGRLSRDPLGSVLRTHALRSGVDLSLTVDAREPTTVALVELDADGTARYRFGVDGTADFGCTDDELAPHPDHARRPCTSARSASWLAARATPRSPGGCTTLRAAGARSPTTPTSDRTCSPIAARPASRSSARVALAHLVKTSDEDLD